MQAQHGVQAIGELRIALRLAANLFEQSVERPVQAHNDCARSTLLWNSSPSFFIKGAIAPYFCSNVLCVSDHSAALAMSTCWGMRTSNMASPRLSFRSCASERCSEKLSSYLVASTMSCDGPPRRSLMSLSARLRKVIDRK